MPVGQYEAATVLGYGKARTFFRIILPQVIKHILPSITNEVITLVKDTSMAFTVRIRKCFPSGTNCKLADEFYAFPHRWRVLLYF